MMNTAVVLAARQERDASIPYPLRPFTENVCLIDRTLAILKETGFKRVYIVAGFCHKLFDKYASEEVSIIYNKDYEFTASMGSLALLKDYIDEDFLYDLGICARAYKKAEFAEKSEDRSEIKQKEPTERAEASLKAQDKSADENQELLAGLDEGSKRIFAEMPIDTAVSPDFLVVDGFSTPDVVTALTMLELCGLVTSLPGGLYMRK